MTDPLIHRADSRRPGTSGDQPVVVIFTVDEATQLCDWLDYAMDELRESGSDAEMLQTLMSRITLAVSEQLS